MLHVCKTKKLFCFITPKKLQNFLIYLHIVNNVNELWFQMAVFIIIYVFTLKPKY